MATLFSQILTILTLITGIVSLLNYAYFRKKRNAHYQLLQSKTEFSDIEKEKILQPGWFIENCHSMFPVFAVVLILRSWIYEPFQIPSGSMLPTLRIGDFILVEKFSYALKDPFFRKTLVDIAEPQRGDVVVFKYPLDESIDYIKRLVGLPGDTIYYRNKRLYIEPKECMQINNQTECGLIEIPTQLVNSKQDIINSPFISEYEETLGTVKHSIFIHNNLYDTTRAYFSQPDNETLGKWIIPKEHYFVMGDNRDNSRDSRYWGFVNTDQLVGKATFIWMSFEFNRDENDILPTWIPTDVRLNRIGKIQ